MKKYLFILVLVFSFSCKENINNAQEKKSVIAVIGEKTDNEIQEIIVFYQPENMVAKQNKVRTDNKKENFQITLTNSDLLDSDVENIEKHSEKIFQLYYKNLERNIVPLNCDKIIVHIEHKNSRSEKFYYSEKDFAKLKTN